MSAAAQLKELVDNAVSALTGEYEDRIKALEDRVAALESAKPAPAATARAGTAKAKAAAQP